MSMNGHFKEVIPVDMYTVQLCGVLHEQDKKVMTLLYQPLVGAFAYSLFMTWWQEADAYKRSSHQHLMNITQFSLKDIFEARKKLEAIGLLKVYKKEDEQSREFLYELQKPLSPYGFFTDGFLNIYLFNRLGQKKFIEVKQSFLTEKLAKEEYKEITSSFSDVFTSLHPSEMVAKGYMEISDSTEEHLFDERTDNQEISLRSFSFDMDLMMADISSFIVPKEEITDEMKEAIMKIAYIYRMDPLEMSAQLQNAYHLHGQLTVENIRKEVQKWYRFENNDGLPSLAVRKQPVPLKALHGKEPATEEEKTIKFFEEVSPYQMLELYSGTKPIEADLGIITHLMVDQKLPAGVVNVLLDYVMRINDMNLAKGLVEKIASHWARKRIQTVPEAINLAKSEKKKYAEWQEKKSASSYKGRRGAAPSDSNRLPDWLNEEQKSSSEKSGQPEEQENKKWLNELLKGL
ncbi:replication initiation and membrane attachment family protein [Fictibacillus iocasae]|uniref:Replication initiation and membrane attachment family protein n=1 Tax=Fictibacillus iocasae TaxID=2715437 RepID=A0ABW2NTI8_9BACL